MTPERIRKLAGGYAAGILTPEERRALFQAALEDQELFNELAREQALKELLDDPAVRRRLLAAIESSPSRWAWLAAMLRRPAVWSAAGALAMAVLAAALMWMGPWRKAAQPVMTAMRPAVPDQAEPTAGRTGEIARDMGAREATEQTPGRALPDQTRAAAAPAEAEARPAAQSEPKTFALADKTTAEAAAEPAPPPATMARAAAPEVGAASSDAAPAALRASVPADEIRAKAEPAVQALAVRSADAAAEPLQAAGRGAASSTALYHLEVAGPQGEWARAAEGAVFQKQDRVRIVFQPGAPGRLRVASAAGAVLLDTDARPGTPVHLEVPAGEAAVTAAFLGASFEIRIPRSP